MSRLAKKRCIVYAVGILNNDILPKFTIYSVSPHLLTCCQTVVAALEPDKHPVSAPAAVSEMGNDSVCPGSRLVS